MTRLAASRARMLLLLLLLLGIIGVTSTYTRISMTDDEGFHMSCGMEWLKNGTYNQQPLHPPLARVMDAIVLYAVNSFYGDKAWVTTPPRDTYIDQMILTRLGILPFYVLSCLLVYRWSRRLCGELSAFFSLALYITLSTVTAHGALATTDMVYTAVFLWALMCGIDWLQNPDRTRSLWLGISVGIMVGTKYSGLAQWPAAMAMIIAIRCAHHFPKFPLHRTHLINAIRYSLPPMALILALIFRFSLGPFINGLRDAQNLNNTGFGIWFYGPLSNHSVWDFFPVVFFFKTPLSFFIAALIGTIRIIREKRLEPLYPLLAALGVMLISMTSHINLGVRHILPLYPLLAIPAGYGLAYVWNKGRWERGFAAIIILCQLTSFVQAYPEHIAYFNSLAGDHPEHITLDSDFDWGQDMILLDEALQARSITSAYMCSRSDTYWNANIVVHAKILSCPKQPTTGWFAVGRAYMLLNDNIAWLKSYDALQIENSTMDLYYVPPHENH